jgi:hypothetical protein
MSAVPGQIYLHHDFYLSRETDRHEQKYLVIVAPIAGGDLVARLLTSRAHGRPEEPPCYHGDPYAGFYLGVIGGRLGKKSWIDLRAFDDLDSRDFSERVEQRQIEHICDLADSTIRAALECVAAAEDTTRLQERSILDYLGAQ